MEKLCIIAKKIRRAGKSNKDSKAINDSKQKALKIFRMINRNFNLITTMLMNYLSN